jgi:hypothetical protein
MEQLNDYLQQLLSSCSDELRLEPDKNPYLVSENRTNDVGAMPLKGTQISTMVFPLIPAAVKSELPHSNEIEFVHPHNLGNFNFTVQKSPSGFMVSIRPLLEDSASSTPIARPEPQLNAVPSFQGYVPEPEPPAYASHDEPVPTFQQVSYDLESSSSAYEATSAESVKLGSIPDLVAEDAPLASDLAPSSDGPDVISSNDPAYQTVFSDTAPLPVRRRSDFVADEYDPAVSNESAPELESAAEPASPPLMQHNDIAASRACALL